MRKEPPSSTRTKHLFKGQEAVLLKRIFDVKGYDEQYEDVNTNLLKKERVYKTREWKLETKQEWKL